MGAGVVIKVEDHGAVGDGTTDDSAAFQAAVDAAAAAGGGTVVGAGPGTTYACDSDVNITTSNITLDGQGATVRSGSTSDPRFVANGDPQSDGGEPQVSNVWFRNWSMGTSNIASERFNGVALQWCADSGATDIRKQGKRGGSFRMSFCKRTTFERIVSRGCDINAQRIMFLVHFGEDCTLRQCTARDAQAWVGYQIKGALRTLLDRCSCADLTDQGGTASATSGGCFLERGDAPYGASSSTGTYPFTTGAWANPDANRESRGTVYRDCWVDNCPFPVLGYTAQEFSDVALVRCSGPSVRLLRTSGGSERGALVSECRISDGPTYGLRAFSNDTTDLPGVRVLGGHYKGHARDGVRFDDCDRPSLQGAEVADNAWAGVAVTGGALPFAAECRFSGNASGDLQLPSASVGYGHRTPDWVIPGASLGYRRIEVQV